MMIMTNFKQLMILGLDGVIEYRSKLYVIKSIYDNARRSPFIYQMKYDEYLDFLIKQILEMSGKHPCSKSEDDLFDALYDIGWIKEKVFCKNR